MSSLGVSLQLEQDYILGLGDCVDLVIVGAWWEKDRGGELRGMRSKYSKGSCLPLPSSTFCFYSILFGDDD